MTITISEESSKSFSLKFAGYVLWALLVLNQLVPATNSLGLVAGHYVEIFSVHCGRRRYTLILHPVNQTADSAETTLSVPKHAAPTSTSLGHMSMMGLASFSAVLIMIITSI